jgi:hypothetical protein
MGRFKGAAGTDGLFIPSASGWLSALAPKYREIYVFSASHIARGARPERARGHSPGFTLGMPM